MSRLDQAARRAAAKPPRSRSTDKCLRRARHTLATIERYCSFQAEMGRSGIISPGETWQGTYVKVHLMLSEWAGKALTESTKARKPRKTA